MLLIKFALMHFLYLLFLHTHTLVRFFHTFIYIFHSMVTVILKFISGWWIFADNISLQIAGDESYIYHTVLNTLVTCFHRVAVVVGFYFLHPSIHVKIYMQRFWRIAYENNSFIYTRCSSPMSGSFLNRTHLINNAIISVFIPHMHWCQDSFRIRNNTNIKVWITMNVSIFLCGCISPLWIKQYIYS